MELSLVLLCFQSLLLRSVTADGPPGNKCSPASGREETCVCQVDGGIIDLTPLSNTDGTPRYADLPDAKKQYTYSYNPCSAYQDTQNKGDCDNIYMCQSHQYVIGGNPGDEQMWIDTDGTPYAYYEKSSMTEKLTEQVSTEQPESPLADPTRFGFVHLLCDPSVKLADTQFIFIGELSQYHYYFNMTSCQVCPGGCDPGPNPEPPPGPGPSKPKGHGSIAGAIGLALIALCIIGIISYFVAGILIMKFYKKASGTDIIPNKRFWKSAPFLIKDGFVFTFGPCVHCVRVKIREKQGYRMN